ncbi:MAG TPA: isoprenylcysteine carboxylmethyltransferase family protein, partial [Candidatus Limnocylindrales bacterium]|nr:isoprenylcysteine carboxylmethyltransferase family protein [Candidatus Limnocylindrales bacterium]
IHARDRAGSAQRWARAFGVTGLLFGVIAALADIFGLVPFAPLDEPAVAGVGIAFVAIGAAGTLAAQLAMGESWRGDVDPDARTALVTTGPFRLVRNPVLASTAITAIGIALLVPNAFAAAMLVAFGASHQTLVRLVEEPYLLKVHGEAYRRYAAVTGRFVPGIGRLRPAGRDALQPDRNHDGSAASPTGSGRQS